MIEATHTFALEIGYRSHGNRRREEVLVLDVRLGRADGLHASEQHRGAAGDGLGYLPLTGTMRPMRRDFTALP